MLFKDGKLNCCFEIQSDSHDLNAYKLCKELERLMDNIIDYPSDIIEINVYPYSIDRKMIKDNVLNRNANDIKNIIFHHEEFSNKLALLNIKKRDKSDKDYDEYLKIIYGLYIIDNLIFPNVRFFDLFKENKWSSENVVDANTGNERYQRCIYDYLLADLKKTDEEYERSHVEFCDAYFYWYQMEYDHYLKDDQIILNNDQLMTFKVLIDDKLATMMNCIDNKKYENNPRIELLSFLKRYEALATINDMKINIDEGLFHEAKYIIDKIDIDSINKYDEYINVKDVDKLFDDEKIKNVVKEVISFDIEQAQYLNDNSSMLLVFEDDNEYYITISDILLIADVYLNMNTSIKYYSKRTYLTNRDDASKRVFHSIRRSFSAKDIDDFKASQSNLRNDLFRLICHMVKNEDEFFYYEIPCNHMLCELLVIPERLDNIYQRIDWFKNMTELLSNSVKY